MLITTVLKKYADQIIFVLEKFSHTRFWLVKSVLIISLITVLYSFQNYNYMYNRKISEQTQADINKNSDEIIHSKNDTTGIHKPSLHEFVERQIINPLTVVRSSDRQWRFYAYVDGNIVNRQFRLTMPVLGHFLSLNVDQLILLQVVIGFFLIAFIILLTTSITGDKVMGILFALGFGFTYLGKACFIDIRPYFDGVAYFLLLAAMFSKKPLLIGVSIFLAAFTDERALIASGLVFLWWRLQSKEGYQRLPDFLKFDSFSIAIIIAWIAYISARIILLRNFHFTTHLPALSGPGSVLKYNYKIFAFGILTGIKWFWIFVLAGLLWLIKSGTYVFLFFFILNLLFILLPAFLITDITKSVTYIFPAVFICLSLFVKSLESQNNLRYFSLIVVILCFLMVSAIIPPA
jgi:hypothetical protein